LRERAEGCDARARSDHDQRGAWAARQLGRSETRAGYIPSTVPLFTPTNPGRRASSIRDASAGQPVDATG
jgi:hypothetical protein